MSKHSRRKFSAHIQKAGNLSSSIYQKPHEIKEFLQKERMRKLSRMHGVWSQDCNSSLNMLRQCLDIEGFIAHPLWSQSSLDFLELRAVVAQLVAKTDLFTHMNISLGKKRTAQTFQFFRCLVFSQVNLSH